LWIISSALSVLDWMALRGATVALVDLIERLVPIERQIESGWYLRWVVRAANPCSLAFFSIFAVVSILGFDYLYRNAIEKGTIKKRFALVTGIQVGILALCGIVLLVSNLVAPSAR
jgi:succinate dehydrogenase hydrophobic anchor subunit